MAYGKIARPVEALSPVSASERDNHVQPAEKCSPGRLRNSLVMSLQSQRAPSQVQMQMQGSRHTAGAAAVHAGEHILMTKPSACTSLSSSVSAPALAVSGAGASPVFPKRRLAGNFDHIRFASGAGTPPASLTPTRHKPKARDALDAALLFETEVMDGKLTTDQREHAKKKANDALGLAVLSEAEVTGLNLTNEELVRAKLKARGALEFALLTERDLNVEHVSELQEAKMLAQQAIEVALLGAGTDTDASVVAGSEGKHLQDVVKTTAAAPPGPEKTSVTRVGALDAAVRLERDTLLCDDLAPRELEAAKEAAQKALVCALEVTVEDAGMDISPQELEDARQLARDALHVALLSEHAPASTPAEDVADLRRRAVSAMHLALLGVETEQ